VRYVSKAYDAVLFGMAALAGLLMVAMMTTIFIDVVLRNLGYQSSAHFFSFTEYALLAVPCLGAPWLVREKGHIYVEMFLTSLSPAARAVAIRLIGALCVAVCVVLAWYGGAITLNDFINAERDVRSFDMPRWIVVGFIPLSFGMMAVEFMRFLLRGENFLGAQSPTDVGQV
jgi:TRAP-type C4-dicarboxylate transport system permease small subunit